MSIRLHSATTYKVEYGPGGLSNSMYGVNKLLQFMCPSIVYNGEYITCAEDIEIPVDEFERAINTLKSYNDENELPKAVFDRSDPLTLEDIVTTLESLFNEADKSDGFVHLSWF